MTQILSVLRFCLIGLSLFIISGCGGKSEEASSNAGEVMAPVNFSSYASGFKLEADKQLSILEADPENEAAILRLADLYMANRCYPRAEKYYTQFLNTAVKSAHPKVLYYLAQIAIARGEIEEAASQLRLVLSQNTDYLPAWLGLGEIHYKNGQPDEARKAFESSLELDPRNPYATLALVQDELRKGNKAGAIQALESMLQVHPHFSEGLALLAKLLEESGESSRAKKLLEQDRYGWDLPPPDPWMEELIPLCYDSQILGFYFEDHRRVGKHERALDFLSRMEAIDPSDPMPYILRGTMFYELEMRNEAESELKTAIEKGGTPGLAHAPLVKTLIELGKLEEAEQTAKAGLIIDPNIPFLHVSLAGLAIQNKDMDQALSYFNQAFKLDPTDTFVCRMVAKLYREKNKPSLAVEPLEKWLQMEPANLEATVSLVQVYLELNQGAKAVHELQQARSRHPENDQLASLYVQTCEQLGNGAFEKEDYPSAVTYFNKAIEGGSESLTVYGFKTQAHIRLGQWQAAEETVLGVIEKHPRVALFYANLGDIQNAAGKQSEAMTSWRIAKSLLTQNDPIELRQKLDLKLGE
ncbi:MAG: tetratricopeptide repeat protein [Verrucomicrobiae bacterium]|nr:tetratricopeptide repeat protein [Verrucomicrobiae bacterium]